MAHRSERDWLSVFTTYLLASVVLHFIWELVQLPLYTLWRTGTAREIGFAIAHCTIGDAMIAGLCLVAAIAIAGTRKWPTENYTAVAACAIAFGISYTVYSERLNLSRSAWAYSEFMPVVPVLGVGLSPLLQWLVVPGLVFLWVHMKGSAPSRWRSLKP